ncbi:ABC transporter ATP-binding protein [Janthinobacterium lividum]|uniref:ABC transporter ATP-binding protein n=1 Tax=Janthinobacterium lividum TaxID=29581 RepID=UPI00087507B5|nr:ABC transporter transmembrane domain-containing protein [Janthinobacterium lividum]MCC7713930.1 ATP-binding cassette domain-containing protein [Janthinobacterium lividum]OEZ60532.1 putative multidrug resistance ABC transporter ATP-binding/permease protein YheI [Janthinobacterium lividum]WQE28126.1 ABC transporter transmembrane domain-containing protein [Janthinobacterium lividum]STQ99063.1 Probable multidrug resistance ABC transporter ATP-binding/permease protein YheI [Janthinobacterium livi
MSLSRLIAGFVRQHWPAYAAAAVMLTGVATLTVWIPRRVGAIIDALAAHRMTAAELWLELLTLLAVGVVIYFLRVGWRITLFKAAYQLGVMLRTRFYTRMSQQGASFYQNQRTGDLMALATNDIDAIEMAAGEAMLAGFDGTLTLLMVLGIMLLGVDWRLACIALLPFPLMGLAFWRISSHIHTASTDSLKRFSALNDHVQESLSGVRTLRALGLEERSSQQFSALAGHAANASLTAQRWEAAYEPAVGLTLTAATALTLGLGGYLVWQGQLTIGALTSFSMYLGQLIWPMFAAGWVLSLIERGRAAWQRLQPMLDAPLAIDDHGTIATLTPGPLQLQDVGFAYAGQTAPALSGISLRLQPGQTLGLVGPTGSGKSTLLRVLLRQVTPQSGTATWSGQPLDAYTLHALRAAISWVPQESFLFSATIADNIALARPGATREEVERAAQLADIHADILQFPDGYATHVGEKGITLSGGQRQRVAIARALLADNGLLLLDDALSAVDTGTETRILQHLEELRRKRPERSAIIASHRLSAVVNADLILVLRDGHVTETGNHDALMQRDGWYASQWRYQQLEASLDAI